MVTRNPLAFNHSGGKSEPGTNRRAGEVPWASGALDRRRTTTQNRNKRFPLPAGGRNPRPFLHRGESKGATMNSIMVIHPYKFEGTWVFDDPRLGLHREPFVAGADTLIDHMVKTIPDAQYGVTILFSASRFPGFQHEFERERAEFGGHWYSSEEFEMEGWLCAALFKYFESAPERLYVQVKPKSL